MHLKTAPEETDSAETSGEEGGGGEEDENIENKISKLI